MVDGDFLRRKRLAFADGDDRRIVRLLHDGLYRRIVGGQNVVGASAGMRNADNSRSTVRHDRATRCDGCVNRRRRGQKSAIVRKSRFMPVDQHSGRRSVG